MEIFSIFIHVNIYIYLPKYDNGRFVNHYTHVNGVFGPSNKILLIRFVCVVQNERETCPEKKREWRVYVF